MHLNHKIRGAECDTLVVGGGLVGMAVAFGLARSGERVTVLDEGDDAYRAARGNFGLVWVQGKGLGHPPYARWTMHSARRWPAFAAELAERTGVDVELSQPGGLTLCLDDEELAHRVTQVHQLRHELAGDYACDVLEGPQVRALLPQAGPQVHGALMCPLDGHANPMRLLRALFEAFRSLGGTRTAGAKVDLVRPRAGGFEVGSHEGVHRAGRVVLAAGLGNRALAPMVGLAAPVRPNRGQILVTERLQPFLTHPTMQVRQTGEGVVQIGDSKEDVGFDDGTTLAGLARIAGRAVRCFPLLERVNIVRTWGALRVMSPDGLPIYQASASCPGAFVVSCHSGVTLAAQHAGPLVDWIRGAPAPPEMAGFTAARFDRVPVH